MFTDFFNHTCDIYKLVEEENSAGYGIKATDTKSKYELETSGVACHFYVKSDGLTINEQEPHVTLNGTIKLALPYGTSIREQDKVVSGETGFEYIADVPRTVHGNHHIVVTLRRADGLKGAL